MDGFTHYFDRLRFIAENEFGYDPAGLYFEPDSAVIWQEYFYAGYSEREAIVQELGE
jgi:hypothetical protein